MHGSDKYKIEYLSLVIKKDIFVLSKSVALRIKRTIEEKLTHAPHIFGKPLRQSLKGSRSLRVGDYRVIYLIEKKTVLIVIIQHRSVVYKEIKDRF